MSRLRGVGKRLVRSVIRGPRVRAALCWLASLYVRLVHRTSRWEVVGGEVARARWGENRPFILVFWHGRLLMMPYIWDLSRPINMMISHHRDGQFVGDTMAHLGIRTVVGSSSRGGSGAVRAMLKLLRDGQCVGLTPDGPRGPLMRASPGVAVIAKLSGLPIIPAAYSSRPSRTLGSWDRFLVARPFSRGVFVWGRAIEVPRDADEAALEHYRLAVEDELNAITADADRLAGRAVVEPAPIGRPTD